MSAGQNFRYCPQCATGLEPELRDGFTRLVCPQETCDFIQWNNPTPVVAAIIEYQNKALMVHNCEWPAKILGLVTGFLEQDEVPEEAIVREVKEEVNLDADSVKFLGHYSFPKMNQLIIAYVVKAHGTISLNEELDDYRLLEPTKVRPWPWGTGLAVSDWLGQLKE